MPFLLQLEEEITIAYICERRNINYVGVNSTFLERWNFIFGFGLTCFFYGMFKVDMIKYYKLSTIFERN